ncbi:hypothetical protein T08_1990, partial [Trichinella sp. T8]
LRLRKYSINQDKQTAKFKSSLFQKYGNNSPIYRYITIFMKRVQNFKKIFFTKNAKTAKSIAHEIWKFSKIFFFPKILSECRKKLENNSELDLTLSDCVFLEIL